jgi:hypothetical protein
VVCDCRLAPCPPDDPFVVLTIVNKIGQGIAIARYERKAPGSAAGISQVNVLLAQSISPTGNVVNFVTANNRSLSADCS